ncbi:unnamed protein product [Cylicocyclus nassatus]|uniref:Uncharacterized protein n=1 Tax=Cylicocyclus nassatus TaxID=53992 RepID=A0AA36DL26_CYLNA|nr:unnamed protein product [Cylicocyclus nassatus]
MDSEGYMYVHPHHGYYPKYLVDVKCKVVFLDRGLGNKRVRSGINYLNEVAEVEIKFHAELTPSNQLKSYNYHASETLPIAPPLRRYESRSSSDEAPPIPAVRQSFRDETSRPTSRVSAFDSYDGTLERTGSSVGRTSTTMSMTSRPSPTPMSMRPPSSTNGYMETLVYQEHATSAYRRETTPSSRDRDKETVEFISWVEDNQYGRQTPSTQPVTPSSQNDTDSLKSEKKRFSLFGKRGSKSQK